MEILRPDGATGCAIQMQEIDSEGVNISTPGYPNGYDNNTEFSWYFYKTDANQSFLIDILDFEVLYYLHTYFLWRLGVLAIYWYRIILKYFMSTIEIHECISTSLWYECKYFIFLIPICNLIFSASLSWAVNGSRFASCCFKVIYLMGFPTLFNDFFF